jgi:hypothetical protein
VCLVFRIHAGELPAKRQCRRAEERTSIPYSRDPRQGQLDVLDGEGLCDTENECARKMCTGGLMFIAAEDNVVLIESKQQC